MSGASIAQNTIDNAITTPGSANPATTIAFATPAARLRWRAAAHATGNTTIESTGNLEATSTGNSTYKATGTMTVQSTAPLTVKSDATVTISGAMVNIN